MKFNTFYKDIIKYEDKHLHDGLGQTRKVVAVYMSGSFARGFANSNSDLDLIMLVHETPHDLLTDVKINCHDMTDDLTMRQDAKERLDLKYVPREIDVKVVGIKFFYKELTKMNPTIIGAVKRGYVYAPMRGGTAHDDVSTYMYVAPKSEIPHMLDTKFINYFMLKQLGYISALLGMANNAQKKISTSSAKADSYKMVDNINYFIKLIVPHISNNFAPDFDLRHNYHKEMSNVTFDALGMQVERSKRLREDAVIDLDNEIKLLNKIKKYLLKENNDMSYKTEVNKVRWQVEELFAKELMKNRD